MDATPARTRRLLAWALVCLVVALGCGVLTALLPEHPSSWFVYAPLDDSFVVPANPQVRRVGMAAVAVGGIGLLLLGAYLIERVREREAAADEA